MAKLKNNEKGCATMRERLEKSQMRRLRAVSSKLLSRLARCDIGMPQVVVLLELCFADEREPARIAERAFIPRQTMATILDKLEVLGLVRRVDHPTDRRRKVIELTQAGLDKASGIRDELLAYEDSVMAVLSKEELALLNSLEDKIDARLTELG